MRLHTIKAADARLIRRLTLKIIVVSVIVAITSSIGAFFTPSHAQAPANDDKPAFYRLVPGTYVNGWPRFTVTYPRDWVEKRHRTDTVFRAEAPEFNWWCDFVEVFVSHMNAVGTPRFAEYMAHHFGALARDVMVITDKPSRLRDGTPARELGLRMVVDGAPLSCVLLAAKRGDVWVGTDVGSFSGRLEQDLRAIPYSLEFRQGFDKPVNLPPDVQAFLDKMDNDVLGHDIEKVMSHYSNRYLNSGVKKGETEQFYRQFIGGTTSVKAYVTDFIPAGNMAYLAGFVVVNGQKNVIRETSIINENGEWKWYGNQRDVASRF